MEFFRNSFGLNQCNKKSPYDHRMVTKSKRVPQFPMSLIDALAVLLKGNNTAPRKLQLKSTPSLARAVARS